MACCLTTTRSHCLNQCWRRSMLPFDFTRPQWVNHYKAKNTESCVSTRMYTIYICVILSWLYTVSWHSPSHVCIIIHAIWIRSVLDMNNVILYVCITTLFWYSQIILYQMQHNTCQMAYKWCFFYVSLKKLLNKHESGQWSETSWHSCDITVMSIEQIRPMHVIRIPVKFKFATSQLTLTVWICFHEAHGSWL